ncbi:hypothetical protein CKO23_21715 [Thiocystis violacea]|nr:hypothetical protein [Thiocystis violacea]
MAAVLAAAVLWGTTGTLQSQLPADRAPMAVGALRLLLGAALLLLLALARRASRNAFWRLPWWRILAAGLAIGTYNLCFFLAVTKAGVGIGTAVAIGSALVWATVYESLADRRWPPRVRLAGQALSVLGVGLLGLAGHGADDSLIGIGLALVSGASYAAYSFVTRSIGHRAPPITTAAATFSVAALMTLPVLLLGPLDWLSGASTWMTLAALGIGATGLAYVLYTWGLARMAASTAVTLALAEPVTAWLLAILVVDEAVDACSLTGVALILAGLASVAIIPDSPRRSVSSQTPAAREPAAAVSNS